MNTTSLKLMLSLSCLSLFCGNVQGDLLFSASLQNGDYGGGAAVNTFPLPGSAPAIANSADGVRFLSSETDGRSNGLINYQLGPTLHNSFRSQGTVSVDIFADRDSFVSGSLMNDNYGFNQFGNGQSTIGFFASRIANGPGIADDQMAIAWNSWHSNVWYNHGSALLELGRWHDIGFTWRGPNNRFELWVDGNLLAFDNTSPNTPWGSAGLGLGSGYNFGLGDNHMRGVDAYGSTAGLTYAHLAIWNEHRLLGDTTPVPEPSFAVLVGLLPMLIGRTRRRTQDRFVI